MTWLTWKSPFKSSDVHLILLHHFLDFLPKNHQKISPKLTFPHANVPYIFSIVLPCSPQISKSKIGKSPMIPRYPLWIPSGSRGQSSEGLQAHLSSEAQRDGDHRAEVHHRRLLLVLLGASLGRNLWTKSMDKWVCLKMLGIFPWNSHLIGIMISKTIGFRGTLFSDTPKSMEIYIYIYDPFLLLNGDVPWQNIANC